MAHLKMLTISSISLLLLANCLPTEKGPLQYRMKALGIQNSSEIDFEKVEATYSNVRKFILEDKCLSCHNTNRAKGGVDLSAYENVFDWSDYFQPIVTKGDPDQSGLYTEVVRGAMPPKKKDPLSNEEIEFLKKWIIEGARP